jgi:preprotein translocase subunit SecD
MLGTIIGGALAHPGDWHSKFKVGLGLDLSSGTTITIKTVVLRSGGRTPTSSEMAQSIAILNSRVNGQGFTGAKVQQQGTDNIVVSVPGKSPQEIAPLLNSAVLRFRQVLLTAPGYPTQLPATSPGSTPSAGGSPSPSTSPSASSSSPSPTPSPSGSRSGASAQAAGSHVLNRAAQTSAKSSSSASASPSPSASASQSASPSTSPTPSPSPSLTTRLPTAADAAGDITKVKSAAVIRDFDRLNCKNKDWQKQIYGDNPNKWDAQGSQTVACDSQGNKYVLDVAKVLGTNLTKVAAVLNQQSVWVVNFNLDGKGQKAFGDLTSQMVSKYFKAGQATSVLDQFAIVLDGKVVSAPQVTEAITTGSGEITGPGGSFTHGQATRLTNVLKYGAVPLAFLKQSTQSISPQLGASQLRAGLIAAAIGLLLVVIYSILYYRGLAIVSVFSLATAALLSWLAVILLSKYQGFTLSLAGVAGLIVAIGITADSFVVYFERLRDEVREGRSLRAAVERGWQRARRTILVSDTVSFLAALLLYIIAIGDVRGFAFTLGLTTLIDVVVVFLFTKPMVTLLARTKFFGRGHKWSGLDPARLGSKSPWRGSRAATARPATGGAAATSATAARTTPKEA